VTNLSGSYSFTVRLTDSSPHPKSSTRPVTLTVSLPLTVAKYALTEAEAGIPYAAWLTANGGVGPYQWSLMTGNLPSGMLLQASNGTITGMTLLSGSFPFTAQVTDSYGQSATLPMNLTVSSTLAIANSELTVADAGMPYAVSLSAAGGVTPYRRSRATGNRTHRKRAEDRPVSCGGLRKCPDRRPPGQYRGWGDVSG
jgi:large repetitive protein